MEPILEAEGLVFIDKIHYPPIAVPKGSTTFVRGGSGSGKTTLLKLFNGTVSPKEGTLCYNGQNIGEADTIQLRRQVLLVSQAVWLFDDTIAENFRRFYEFRQQAAPGEEQMRHFLDLCQADFPLDANCALLSGGERQRVYIALFLSFMPTMLLLDEPTSALDTATAHALMESLQAFCRQKAITLVVVSHDGALAQRFAGHTIQLEGES